MQLDALGAWEGPVLSLLLKRGLPAGVPPQSWKENSLQQSPHHPIPTVPGYLHCMSPWPLGATQGLHRGWSLGLKRGSLSDGQSVSALREEWLEGRCRGRGL